MPAAPTNPPPGRWKDESAILFLGGRHEPTSDCGNRRRDVVAAYAVGAAGKEGVEDLARQADLHRREGGQTAVSPAQAGRLRREKKLPLGRVPARRRRARQRQRKTTHPR